MKVTRNTKTYTIKISERSMDEFIEVIEDARKYYHDRYCDNTYNQRYSQKKSFTSILLEEIKNATC